MIKVKKRISKLLSLVMICSLFTGLTFTTEINAEDVGKTFFVAQDGSDSNEGTIGAPFATLEKARDAIRDLKSGSGLPQGGVTVYIRSGVYNRTQSFELNEQDSGTEIAPIIYKAYNDEKVSIMGGYNLDSNAFTNVLDATILDRLPNEAKEKVVQIDLNTQGITEYGEIPKNGFGWPQNPPAPELFIDSKTMTLARYPNSGFMTTGTIVKEGFIPRNHMPDKGGPGYSDDWLTEESPIFQYSDDYMNRWALENEVWLFGYWKWDWADDNLKVTMDTVNKQFVAENPSFYGISRGKRFYAYNLLSELDIPGEWYLDRTSGILYVYPESDITSSTVQISLLNKPLINMENASNITIEDIIFEISCGDGIKMMDCSNNLIAHCTLRRLGQKAVAIGDEEAGFSGTMLMDSESGGGRNNGVVACDIYDTGAGGISIIGGDRNNLIPAGNYAENNHIFNYARLIRTYTAAVSLNGVGNQAKNNVIHDAPHLAIRFRGNDLVIENNEIYNVCTETADAGVIYSPRDWTYRGNVIKNNFIHDIPTLSGLGSYAIYLDDMMSSADITGNIFYNIANYAFLIGGGRDNNIENNIFINCRNSMHLDARGIGWASYHAQAPNGTCYKALINVPYKEEPWRSKYPKLVNIWEDNAGAPKGNVVKNNVRYNSGGNSIASSVRTYGEIVDSLIVTQDPGFVDAANMNFTLSEDSIIYQQLPEFEPIAFDQIGLKIDQYRDDLSINIGDFSLTAPENNEVDMDPLKTPFTWQSSELADLYELVISEDENFSNIVVDQEFNTTSTQITSLKANTTYYWKVRAFINSTKITGEKWSSVYQFTTGQPNYFIEDDFENGLDNWNVAENGAKGTKTVSDQQAHSGTYSYIVNEDMDVIEKQLGKDYNAVGTIWYYDDGYTGDRKQNLAMISDGTWLAMGVDTSKTSGSTHYVIRDEGTYLPTSVMRTEGWHRLVWDATSGNQMDLYIDDTKVYTTTRMTSFNYVAFGDWWGNNGIHGTAYYDDFKIYPTVPVETVELNRNTLEIHIGETVALTANVMPLYATNKNLTWDLGQVTDGIAQLEDTGEVTGLGVGEAKVTVRAESGAYAECVIKVIDTVVDVEEGFENGLDNWTVADNDAKGTKTVSNQQAHSGTYSYVVDEDMDVIEKQLGNNYNAVGEIWYYDDGYTGGRKQNLAMISDGSWLAMGVDTTKTNGSTHYVIRDEGNYMPTSVERSQGWHKLVWDTTSGNQTDLYIDDTKVYTTTRMTSFNYVAFGDWWGNNGIHGIAYYDDFKVSSTN